MRHPRALAVVIGLMIFAGLASSAHASFHLWEVKEVYSNATGSIQYVELFTTSTGQQFLDGATISATSSLGTRTFTFSGNSPAGTSNKHLLIATPGFANIPGQVTPDFFLPCGPFFDPASATITINFGAGQDVLTIDVTTPDVPTDGTQSLSDATLNGNSAVLTAAANSPTNFAGSVGSLALTTCQNDGTCDACTDAAFCNGVETCSLGACAGPDPCPLMCSESGDVCFECVDTAGCDDSNPCTDEVCNGAPTGVCVRTNNTATCNDNLFCTTDDVCSGSVCAGPNLTCVGNCSEGLDVCGDCALDVHCDDSVFCNGAEICTTGACGDAAAGPCDPLLETCEEPTDVCQAICGNGALDGAEVCDDGNAVDDDGCTACAIDDGFTCDVVAEPSVCTAIPAPDAGVPDAEVAAPDAGTDPPDEDEGCCSTGGGPRGGSATLLVLLGAALWRRRRAHLDG